MPDLALRHAPLAALDPVTLYRLLQLRQDVFLVEQKVTDPDLDGRELEPTTTLMWLETADGDPVAHVRLLREADGSARIGRVAVRADHRRGGHGRRLMLAALERAGEIAPGAEVHIDAQAHLEHWYGAMGFETVSGLFLEAGIEHVAMVRRA
ncbi:GNAT family N-acetyltransferase [Brachybacterium sp. YJGR34]|uniref:GNAT family N-acetyltransferase n=1 Tax=Brachybacterium sp. YJGR34 TaxID=2059911 RepID=UPI000E0A91CA|nr:GNAT family N-acetyltransferase [Brachybacterium sp. YJGR34]